MCDLILCNAVYGSTIENRPTSVRAYFTPQFLWAVTSNEVTHN